MTLPALQQPQWPDRHRLEEVVSRLEGLPPLVLTAECDQLKERLAAVAHYLTSHLSPATLVHGHPAPSLIGMSLIHGYTTGFWVGAGIFGAGAVICGTLFRSGPLRASGAPTPAPPRAAAQQATAHVG